MSKIFAIVNFRDIQLLPARELAYTAHLGSRAGVSNEKFWSAVKEAFLQDTRMRPKQLTQIFVALAKTGNADASLAQVCLRRIAADVSAFRIAELVQLLHAFCGLKKWDTKLFTSSLADHLAKDLSSLNVQQLALLVAAVGKLGIRNATLADRLMGEIGKKRSQFDQVEFAAIVRALASLGDVAGSEEISSLLDSAAVWTEWDPGARNIVLHGLWKMGYVAIPAGLYLQIFKSALKADAHLLPNLFFHAAHLTDQAGLDACVRMGANLVRNFKRVKAISLPVVFEGVAALKKKFPQNDDVKVLFSSAKSLTESVIDRFLLLSTVDEKRALLEGKHARYSEWFRSKISESLEGAERAETPKLNSMELLWSASSSMSPEDQRALLATTIPEPTDLFHSLLFRYFLKNLETLEFSQHLFARFSPEICSHKTLARLLQLFTKSSHIPIESELIVAVCLSRIEEVKSADLLGFLLILKSLRVDFHQQFLEFADAVERKVVRELDLLKSHAAKSRVVRIAETLGLDPRELVDSYEELLALEGSKQKLVH